MSELVEVERAADGGSNGAEDAGRRPLLLVFKGNARDYFRIWIVNLCLTLFTFGIFSAWAKVRKKRYFYSHTELEGVPFEYLANPIPILKGRSVGALLLALWYIGTHFFPALFGCVLVVGLLLAPWAAVRSAAFNARYSAYRNMTFHFSGTYWGAAKVLLSATLLVSLSFGFGAPWALTRVRRYFVRNTSFGGIKAKYRAQGGHLALAFLVPLGAMAVAGLVLLTQGRGPLEYGPGLTTVFISSYVLYGLCYAYLQARIARVNWRHTTLGPIDFYADYRARDFVWLYFSNALAVLCSFGLLVPWATVRMVRYRIHRLSVEQSASLDAFVGRREPAVPAVGAEVADLFDLDLSL
jgi:uncharacterized membrane protein YjgN (DUF898 family)